MTDDERIRVDAELAAALLRLKEALRRVHEGIHEFLNLQAIWLGEMELISSSARRVVERVQQDLDEFYAKFPEFRD